MRNDHDDGGTVCGLQRLAQSRLLDVGAVLLALLALVRLTRDLPVRAKLWDFNHHYVSSRLLIEGANPYTTPAKELAEQLGFPFAETYLPTAAYPPTFFWLFAPLALLPPGPAYVGWLLAQAVSLGLILWFVRRLLPDWYSTRGWRLICLGVLASDTISAHFYYSHVELLLAAAVLAAYVLLRAGKPTAACLVVTAAGMVKLYPFVWLPWFVWRSGDSLRTRATHAGLAAAFGGLVFGITGPGLWRDFFHRGLPLAAAGEIGYTFHFSAASFLTNLGYAAYGFEPPLAVGRLWCVVGVAAGLAIIGAACVWGWRRVRDSDLEFCVVSVAVVVGLVNAQGQYFVYLIFPMALAAALVAARPTWPRVVVFALIAAVLMKFDFWTTPFRDSRVWLSCLKLLVNYVPLYAQLALGIFLVKESYPVIKPSSSRPQVETP